MDYQGLVKASTCPPGTRHPPSSPTRTSRPGHGRADLDDDVRGINASLEIIQRTRGGGWPTEAVSADFNYVDLVWHELEFREGYSFTYAVYDSDDHYLGCCYFYPWEGARRYRAAPGVRRQRELVGHADAYHRGFYAKLYIALRRWVGDAFPFYTKAYYCNGEIPGRRDA